MYIHHGLLRSSLREGYVYAFVEGSMFNDCGVPLWSAELLKSTEASQLLIAITIESTVNFWHTRSGSCRYLYCQ